MKKLIALVVAVIVLVVVPVASAASGSSALVSGYGTKATKSVVKVAGTTAGATPSATPAATASTGTLPFTGIDLAFVAGAGAALVAAGIGVRRLGRNKQ